MGPQVASWLRPEAVCEVDCLLITADLMLRAPSFIRMRNDKAPEECVI
jgi:ATP-dependent DNA ligase